MERTSFIKGTALTAVLLGLAFWGPGSAADVDGKKVFDKKCASCHGKDGAGNPKMLKMTKATIEELGLTDPDTLKKTDKELAAIIADGVKGKKMAAWGKKLKAEEIDALVKYIRSLPAKKN